MKRIHAAGAVVTALAIAGLSLTGCSGASPAQSGPVTLTF